MMRRFTIFILLLFLNFGIFVLSSSAEDFSPDKMDFYDAVKYSLEHNNNIRAMRKNLSATERDIGIERSGLMPKIRFNEHFTSTNNPTDALAYRLNQTNATANDLSLETLNHPGSVPNFLTSGIVEQPVYNRRAMVAVKMAKKEYSANGYFYLRAQEELVTQVAFAYLSISTDQEFVKVAELAVADAKAHLKIAEDRNKNNSKFSPDVLRIKTALQEHEQKLITAQRNLKVAKRKLGLVLGLENSIEISNPLPEITLQDMNYYKEFSVYRNDIKATEIRVENAKNNIQLAQSEWYPTFDVLASYSLYNSHFPFGAEGNNYTAGAYFRWNLFDGNKRKYERLKAIDKQAEAKEYLEGLKKTVSFNVYEVYSNVEEHKKNLELAIAARKAAEEDVKLIEKSWRNMLSPLVVLTDAQSHLNEARANVVRCQNDLAEDLINLVFESGITAQELAIK